MSSPEARRVPEIRPAFPDLPEPRRFAWFAFLMQRQLVKDALKASAFRDAILLQGWVRTRRYAKGFSFVELNDGSCLKSMQVVIDAARPDYPQVARAHTGTAIEVRGRLVASQGQGQKWEVAADTFRIVGEA